MAGWKLRKDKTPAETSGAVSEAPSPAEEPTQAEPAQEYQQEHKNGFAQAYSPEPQEEHRLSEPIALDSAPALPDFDADTDFHFSDLGFDGDASPLTQEAALPAAVPQDDAPLTLAEHTETDAVYAPTEPIVLEPAAPEPATAAEASVPEPPIVALSAFEPHEFDLAPLELPADEMPAPEISAPEISAPEIPTPTDDFLQRMRIGRDLPFEPVPIQPVPVSVPVSSNGASGIPIIAPFVLDTLPADAPPVPASQLVIHIGRLSAAYPLAKDTTTIGRPDSALHYYPDVEIDMDDAVSRRHAEVLKRPDGFYLADTGSTNGTLLNGEKLTPHEERLLAHGDRIRVGDRTEIIFE